MNICIYGASSNQPGEVYFQDAETLGRLIAEAGHTLVFGGGRDGLMGACARGALHAGGRVVGIAPEMFLDPGFLLDSCSEMILTASMAERKEKMLALSDAFICLAGGIGTMDEFFETVTLKQLGLVSGPLVLLNTEEFYTPLLELLQRIAPVPDAGRGPGGSPPPGNPAGQSGPPREIKNPPTGGFFMFIVSVFGSCGGGWRHFCAGGPPSARGAAWRHGCCRHRRCCPA